METPNESIDPLRKETIGNHELKKMAQPLLSYTWYSHDINARGEINGAIALVNYSGGPVIIEISKCKENTLDALVLSKAIKKTVKSIQCICEKR